MTSGSSSLSFVLGISPSRRTRCPSKRLNCEFRERDYRFMNMALEQAKLAYDEGEVPVGCVLVSEDGEILSMGRNRVHSKMDCTCHAEIECLRSAMAAAHNWRLLGSVIYCTLEPCLMCLGAIQLARVAKLKYGADDVRMGAVHSWVRSVP
uniref:CMP/dCMP-type deaminase domain-containing protein n=2 Tax=Rhodosorus marinus TaxID=101924 RepID=A0A7S2ZI06_9RHOD|mmetsp:Transcript_19739/g.78521  ORF Transcript_19739/g.78521 Transcript_19739/m.78521 type:complete len:151 (+) Transcript_19739:107-559(+)